MTAAPHAPDPSDDARAEMRRWNYLKTTMAAIVRRQRWAMTAWGIGLVEVFLVWLPNKYRLPPADNNAIAIAVVLAVLAAQVPVLRCTCPVCHRRYPGLKRWLASPLGLPPCRHCGFDFDARTRRRRGTAA